MKHLYLLPLLLTLPFLVKAQQKPQYSQYMNNNFLLNPAITGIEDYLDVRLGNRHQWTGIEGAPSTIYLSAHAKLMSGVNVAKTPSSLQKPTAFSARTPKYRRIKAYHGLGGVLLRDKIGPFARTEMGLSYAYHLPLTARVRVSGGFSAGLINHTLRPDEMTFANPADQAGAGWQMLSPDLSAGLWLYSDNFYLGLSASQLMGRMVKTGVWTAEPYALQNHYFVTGAYKFPLGPKLALIPSVLVKWVQPLPLSVDYNVRVMYADQVWGGLSFRQGDSFIFLGGVTLNHIFDVSYAYDLGVSSLGRASAGSHEVMLGMRLFNKNKIACAQKLW